MNRRIGWTGAVAVSLGMWAGVGGAIAALVQWW